MVVIGSPQVVYYLRAEQRPIVNEGFLERGVAQIGCAQQAVEIIIIIRPIIAGTKPVNREDTPRIIAHVLSVRDHIGIGDKFRLPIQLVSLVGH